MAQPTPYDRQANFQNIQALAPSDPISGATFDEEFNAIKQTLDEVLNNIALIQRDDGEIANNTIGNDQLAVELLTGLSPAETWSTGVDYSEDDTVFHDSTKLYRALEDHTSGVFADDLAADKWVLVTQFDIYANGVVTNAMLADATLKSLANLGTAADRIAYTTGVDTWAETPLTSFGRSLIDDANAAAALTTLGAQPLDATLTAFAALTIAADKLPYGNGSDTFAVTDFTAAARSLLDDANASAMRTTLGLAIGTDVQAFDAALSALAANSTNGLWAVTGSGATGSARTITSIKGIVTANGDGVSGDPQLQPDYAVQSEWETPTADVVSDPLGTNWHPGVAKGWVKAGVTGNILASHNVSGVADTATGQATVSWGTDFSSADYACAATSNGAFYAHTVTAAAGSIILNTRDAAGTLTDPTNHFGIGFGDQ